MKTCNILTLLLGAGVSTLCVVPQVHAASFTVTSTLSGDPRVNNPDGLQVDVTITGDDATNQAFWTVKPNSPLLHPDIKLGSFAFNLFGNASDYSFSDFNPTNWSVTSPGNNVPGSGSADFLFLADASGNSTVTNTQALTFKMTYGLGNVNTNLFLTAPASNTAAGSGQLGAHLQSLTVNSTTCPNGSCSTSGFAVGSYALLPPDPSDPVGVPEPSTFLGSLSMLGMCGYLGYRKKQQAKQKVA